MSESELLSEVAAVLFRLGIPFMLTGSHASSFQGQARSTHDIDLVVSLNPADVKRLAEAFRGERFYLSETAMQEAVRDKRTFNLLHVPTGEKVDFWLLTDSDFDQSRFGRRQRIDFVGQPLDISSPEDTILMKLLWASKMDGSEKQLNDVLHIYTGQAARLDLAYIENWLAPLGVADLWQRVKDKAKSPGPN